MKAQSATQKTDTLPKRNMVRSLVSQFGGAQGGSQKSAQISRAKNRSAPYSREGNGSSSELLENPLFSKVKCAPLGSTDNPSSGYELPISISPLKPEEKRKPAADSTISVSELTEPQILALRQLYVTGLVKDNVNVSTFDRHTGAKIEIAATLGEIERLVEEEAYETIGNPPLDPVETVPPSRFPLPPDVPSAPLPSLPLPRKTGGMPERTEHRTSVLKKHWKCFVALGLICAVIGILVVVILLGKSK